MKKLALLLSLLALGALGLVACGGGDDDQTTAASETETTAGSGGDAVAVAADPGNENRLSDEERLEQTANEWAAAFAKDEDDCEYYTPQPTCERAGCKTVANRPIRDCTPPSSEFRKSFANATVERISIGELDATVEFSNGESVGFEGVGFRSYVADSWIEKITRANI